MLVLSRHEFTPETPEKILIGEDIEIVVIRAAHGKARIGIVAPPEVAISRSELGAPQRSLVPTERTPPPPVAAHAAVDA